MGTRVEISVAEAKKKFSDLLGKVSYGEETIVITRRGRPVAKIAPLDQSDRSQPLALAKGWLADDDPFFTQIKAIVKSRSRVKLRNPRD